ncbi:MAG: L-histidine N(alpha)-methyltransferase [Pseudomonadota bacterium]
MTSEPREPGDDTGRFAYFDRKPHVADMRDEVTRGLRARPKRLAPKYFYDEAGSRLFEKITELPEYYLTRTEMALFDVYLETIAGVLGEGFCLVEYGSGSTQKIRKLLERLRPAAYVPVDISGEHLEAGARALHRDFPWLDVFPTCADITTPFPLPAPVRGLPLVGFFPGSSIGNFEPDEAEAFLGNVRRTLGNQARLLIGVDRKKDPATLEAAYNDAGGVTAAFNANALAHINQRLGADFDLAGFAHEARYNADRGCVQMFLRSRLAQTVRIGDETFTFEAGELVHTENSFKYHPEEFVALAARSGFACDSRWTDEAERFGLFLLRAV